MAARSRLRWRGGVVLRRARFRTLGYDVNVALDVFPDVVQRKPETVLGKLRVYLCQSADGAVIPDQKFAFGNSCRGCRIGRRVSQQRCQAYDVPWNLP